MNPDFPDTIKKRELIEQLFPKGGKGANQYKEQKSEYATLADFGITKDESSDACILLGSFLVPTKLLYKVTICKVGTTIGG